MNSTFSLSLLSALCLFAATGAAGCAVDGATSDVDPTEAASSELGSRIDVPNPSGAYFATITANGTGCPAGSYSAEISPDGQSFVVAFGQYEATVNPGQSMAMADCTLGIDVRSPRGLSFAVTRFRYEGFVSLDEPGMRARNTAKYYFQGNPLPANEARSDIQAPTDDSFVFDDNIGVADLAWSPCGTVRRLNAQTRLLVQNNPQRSGSGYIAMAPHEMRIRFDIQWRSC